MAVILYYYLRMFCLYHCAELAEHRRLSHARHVLEAYFGCASLNQLVGNGTVVFRRVYGRRGYAERGLRGHAGIERIVDARDDVAHIVETAEYAGNVNSLRVLNLVHELPHVCRHGEHTQRVESAIEHMGLYARLVERLGERPYSLVGIFAVKEVNLLKRPAVGLHTRKAPHLDDCGRNALKLVLARLVFARRLEHVAINETELDFLLIHDLLLCLSYIDG